MTTTIGICGIGSIGAKHARAFTEVGGVELVAWDPIATPEEVLERTRVPVRVVASLDELVAASEGVVVASPDHRHAEQVLAAHRAGCAVLVEKPVAPTAADVVTLRAQLDDESRILVGYVLHHHASIRRAREIVDSGVLGTIASFHATVGAYDTLRFAVNRFSEGRPDTLYIDYSHEWDLLRWFVGPMRSCIAVAALRGDLPLRLTPNVVDALLVGDDVSGTAHLDYLQDPGMRELTIIGDRGTLSVSATTSSLRLRLHGEVERGESFEGQNEAGLAVQARHFLAVTRGEAAPAVTLLDGLAALRVAEGVKSSAATGRWTAIVTDR